MENVYVPKAASAHKLNFLAEWVRDTVAQTADGKLDVIRFIEIDLQKLFPGLYLHVEEDHIMGSRRAFVTDEPLGLVVSESIYEGASNGCLFSSEVILHEVGHLFLHHRYSSLSLNNADAIYKDRIKHTGFANSAEWQASTFAICFLYPYRKLRDCKNADDVRRWLPVTQKQAGRVLQHLKRLRTREMERDTASDTRWLKSVISALPKRSERPVVPDSSSTQLSLFSSTCDPCYLPLRHPRACP